MTGISDYKKQWVIKTRKIGQVQSQLIMELDYYSYTSGQILELFSEFHPIKGVREYTLYVREVRDTEISNNH